MPNHQYATQTDNNSVNSLVSLITHCSLSLSNLDMFCQYNKYELNIIYFDKN